MSNVLNKHGGRERKKKKSQATIRGKEGAKFDSRLGDDKTNKKKRLGRQTISKEEDYEVIKMGREDILDTLHLDKGNCCHVVVMRNWVGNQMVLCPE